MAKNKTVVVRFLVLGFVILEWLITGYLSFRSSQLGYPTGLGPDYCQVLFGIGCDNALTDRAAWQLGYPLANWGLIYFGLIGLLLAFDRRLLDNLALLIVSVGVGAILVTYTFVRDLPSCPLCIIVHILNIIIWLTLWWVKSYSTIESGQRRRSFFKWRGLVIAELTFTKLRKFSKRIPT